MTHTIFKPGLHNVLLYLGLIGLAIAAYGTLDALMQTMDARIIARQTACETPLNNRCRYVYTLLHPAGGREQESISGYVFDPKDLNVPNLLVKQQFTFAYTVNGIRKHWPFGLQCLEISAASLGLISIWVFLNNANRIHSRAE